MTTTVLSSGYTGSGLTVTSGNELLVLSGAVAEDTRLLGGGVLVILAGGSAVGATDSGGVDRVSSGGSTTSTTVLAGGMELVASGGLASGAVIWSGGEQIVSGMTVSAVVHSGGVQVAEGGVSLLSGTVIKSGGRIVLSNFFAIDFPTLERGGYIDIPGLSFSSYGLATLVGGSINIQQGVSIDTIGLAGSYGADLFVMLPDSSGGTQVERETVFASSGAVVANGRADVVALGQSTTAARIKAGGVLVVLSGGSAVGASDIGGDDVVLSGGSTTSTSVQSGGTETVSSGGSASGSVISNGGEQIVSGLTVSAVVLSGGVQVAEGGASLLSGTVIKSGGRVVLSDFFAIDFPTLERGGYIDIPGLAFVNYGLATFTGSSISVHQGAVTDTIGLAGGYGSDLFVMLPDSDGGTEIERVAATTTIASGVTGSDLTISNGFTLRVVAGGRVDSTAVLAGGVLQLASGGLATSAIVAGGGAETILPGGKARATRLSGGTEYDFGTALGTVVLSGGHERVGLGGSASGSIVSQGGYQAVSSGGVAMATKVSGGALVVSAGGRVSGGLVIEAGAAIISGTMGAYQAVRFAGSSGKLELANLAGFHANIAGFAFSGQRIELDGFKFQSGETLTWSQSGTSGTLTVKDGASTARLTLIGSYATSDFVMHGDSKGGTNVMDAAGAASVNQGRRTLNLVHAAAGLQGGRAWAAALAPRALNDAPDAPPMATATSGR